MKLTKSLTKILISMMLVLARLSSLEAQTGQFHNVLAYGAKNDSSEIGTEAIRNAIEAASAQGGGTIYFPAGKYLTGPIHLKSNITIFIDAGAVLCFSDDFDDYLPMVESRWEGTDVMNFSPLFYAHEAENIAITGRGTIDGNGRKWWDFHYKLYDKNTPRSKWQKEFDRNNKDIVKPDDLAMIDRGFLRPPFIQFMHCKNVLIEGITIRNSPFWTVNPEFCDNVTITGLTILNPQSPNTDGINPESCSNVHISNCHISVGDDCITIKSGKDRAGRRMAAPAENYTITNCTMLSGHGGVVIGSEMSGGVKKITISNCIFDGTDRGIRIKTTRGRGGVVEDIRVDNVVMKDIRGEAIVLNMFYKNSGPEAVSERTPQFKNIRFSNITAQANSAVRIIGIEEMPVENISFHDIQFITRTGIEIKEARNIELHNLRITTESGPALLAENVVNLEIDGVQSQKPLTRTPMLLLKNVQRVFLHSCFPPQGTETFVELQGDSTRHLVMKNNNFLNVKTPLMKDDEIGSVTIE